MKLLNNNNFKFVNKLHKMYLNVYTMFKNKSITFMFINLNNLLYTSKKLNQRRVFSLNYKFCFFDCWV